MRRRAWLQRASVQGEVNMTESPRQTAEPLLPGEAGPRIIAAIVRGLRRELSLACHAARQFRRCPALAVAVVVLSTLAFASDMFSREWALRRYYPDLARAVHQPTPSKATFVTRWAQPYRHGGLYPVLFAPVGQFARPLRPATAPADGLILVLWWRLSPPERAFRFRPWRDAGLALLFLVPSVVASSVFLVVLLGWIRDSNRRLRMRDWPRYWKAYYAPVLPVAMIPAVWQAMPLLTILLHFFPFSWAWSMTEGNLLSELAAGGVGFAADVLRELLFLGPPVAVMLAPYVVVARNVGAWKGIVEGLRLLGRHWLALVTLFVLYRIGYEVVAVWNALSPWPTERRALTLTIPVPVLWVGVGEIGLALLGLWVAYAFVEIARGPVPAPVEQNRP